MITAADKYRMACWTAGVAGVLALVVGALMAYDYSRRLVKDPLDSAAFADLKDALARHPTDNALKGQIRDLDLQLRREYFRQRAFTAVGAILLTVGILIFVIAAKAAVTLRRPLPQPQALPSLENFETRWTRTARRAVAAAAALLILVAVALSFSLQSELPTDLPSPAGRGAGGEGVYEGSGFRVQDSESDIPHSAFRIPHSTTSPHPHPLPKGEGMKTESPPLPEEFAQAWPRFRGPGGRGVSAYQNIPVAWDVPAGKNLRWKTPVPLPGNNSPVVWRDRVFLSGADQNKRQVYCFDAGGGKLLWTREVPSPLTPGDSPGAKSTALSPHVDRDTGYAAPTVATDGRRVFAMFANGDLAAFDFEGNPAWSKHFDITENVYGYAQSLLMHDGMLIVPLDQGSAESPKSKLYALDAATGKVVWRINRPVGSSWATPITIRLGPRDLIVTAADPWISAYDPSDGAEVWRVKGLTFDQGASPTSAGGKVFAANTQTFLSAVRADGRGDVTGTHLAWKGEDGLPEACSVLADEKFVFLQDAAGTLTCYDAQKGGVLWSEDFEEHGYASPSLVGDKVYVFADSGKCWVVEATPKACKRISENNLGEPCVTSPAFQDGCFYIRGNKNLICIGTPEKK